MVDESCKVDDPVKTKVNVWLSLTKIGVNEPLFVKENEFRFNVHDFDIIMFLLVWEFSKS